MAAIIVLALSFVATTFFFSLLIFSSILVYHLFHWSTMTEEERREEYPKGPISAALDLFF